MDIRQVLQALRNADAAGDVEGARRLAVIAQRLMQESAPEEPPVPERPAPKQSTVGGEFMRGLKSVGSGLQTSAEAALGSDEEAAQRGLQRGQQLSQQYGQGPSFQGVKDAYARDGLLGAGKQALSDLPRAIAGQLPNLAGMAGSAKLGAMAGAPLGPIGAGVGAAAGTAAYLLPQFFGQNIEAQAAADIEAGRPVDIESGKAFGAAAGQAVLEGGGTALALGKRVVTGILGINPTQEAAKALARDKLVKLAGASIAGGAARGVAVEIPVEIAQSVIQRAQAGEDVLSDEALSEYGEAAYLAGLVGAPLGGAGNVVTRRGAQQDIKALDEREAQAKAAEQKRLQEEQQAAEQARRQTPEYLEDLDARFNAARQELAKFGDLKKPAKPKDASPEQELAYEEALAAYQQRLEQVKALKEQYRPLRDEYKEALPRLQQLREQQRLAGMSEFDVAFGDTPEVPSTTGAGFAPLQSGDEELGFVPPTRAGAGQPDAAQYAAQRIQLAMDQQLDPTPAQIVEYLLADPQMARAVVEQQTALPGLPRRDQQQVRETLRSVLRLQDKEKAAADRAEVKAELGQRQEDLRAQRVAPEDTSLDLFTQGMDEVETLRREGETNFDYLDPLFEKALGGQQPAVKAPDNVQVTEGAERMLRRLDELEQTAAGDPRSEATKKAQTELLQLTSNDGTPFMQELRKARVAQSQALMELQSTLDDIRSGIYLGGESQELATATRPMLNKRAEQAKRTYIEAMLQEAAVRRRAAGQPALSSDAALRAADAANTTLDELLMRGQALPRDAQGPIVVRPAEMSQETANLRRAVDMAQQRVLRAQQALRATAENTRGMTSPDAIARAERLQVQAEKQLADNMLALEQAKRRFAEARKKLVQGEPTLMKGDIRDVGERPFGRYRAALGALTEQLDQIRAELNSTTTTRTRVPRPDEQFLRPQIQAAEAQRVAEESGETAKTQAGRDRRERDYVETLLEQLRQRGQNVEPLRDRLEQYPSRPVLEAVRAIAETRLAGRAPSPQERRNLDEAVRAARASASSGVKDRAALPANATLEERAADARAAQAPQGELFSAEETLPPEARPFTRATPANFSRALERSPEVLKARKALRAAKEAVKTVEAPTTGTTVRPARVTVLRGDFKVTAQVRAKSSDPEIQNALDAVAAQRERLAKAMAAAREEALAADQKARDVVYPPAIKATQQRLADAREELAKWTTWPYAQADGTPTKPELVASLQTEIAETQARLDALLQGAVARADSTMNSYAFAQDSVVQFEKALLTDMERALENTINSNPNIARQREMGAAAAEQRKRVAVEEKRARDIADAQAKQRREFEQRLRSGSGMPTVRSEERVDNARLKRQYDALTQSLETEDPEIAATQQKIQELEALPKRDTAARNRLYRARTKLSELQDKEGARREALEQQRREVMARMRSSEYLTQQERDARAAEKKLEQERGTALDMLKKAPLTKAQQAAINRDAQAQEAMAEAIGDTGVMPVPPNRRSTSAAFREGRAGSPRKLRTGSAESLSGANTPRPAAVGIKETTRPAPSSRAISASDMEEANRASSEQGRAGVFSGDVVGGAQLRLQGLQEKERRLQQDIAGVQRTVNPLFSRSVDGEQLNKQQLLPRLQSQLDQVRADIKDAQAGLAEASRSEGAEANRIAEAIRRKSASEKARDAKEAAAVARELAKSTSAKPSRKAKTSRTIADMSIDDSEVFDPTDLFEMQRGSDDALFRENNGFYASRKTTPLSATAAEAAQDGRILDVLDDVAANGSTPFVRDLAAKLRPLLLRTKLRVDASVEIDGKSVEGKYEPSTNTATLHPDALNEEALLHELVHAATLRALSGQIQLTPAQQKALADLQALYDSMRNDPEFATEYANKNLAEFVSELMSNQQVRDKIDAAQDRGLLERLYDGLLRLLGLRASDKAVQDAFALFAPSRSFDYKYAGVASVMRGVFPATRPVFADVPADVSGLAGKIVGRSPTLRDKILANVSGLAFRTQFLDQYAPIERLLEQGVARGIIKDAQALQTSYFLRFGAQRNQFVSQSATAGVPQLMKDGDERIIQTPEGERANLSKIAQILNTAGVGNEQATEELFTTYLAVRRAEQVGYNKLNFDSAVTPADAKRLDAFLASRPEALKAFEQARKMYREYNDNLLDLLQQTDAMSKAKVAALKKGDYIPYYRQETNGNVLLMISGEQPIRIGNIKDQPYLEELVGGNDKILPFFSGAMQNTSMLIDMALRNKQVKEVALLLQNLGASDIRKGAGPSNRNTVRFMIDGDPVHIVVTDAVEAFGVPADLLVKGLEGIKTTLPAALKVLQVPTNILRAFITRSPAYALRQLIREPINAWMVSGANFTPVASSAKELARVLRNTSTGATQLERTGAISSNVFTGDIQDNARILRDVQARKTPWQAVLAAADKMALASDTATRAVVYDKLRAQGLTHMQATLATLETMNFSRRGLSPSMQMMSMLVPFFNAQVQGIDVIYRAMTGKATMDERLQVQRKLMSRGLMVAAGTMAYAAMMQDDEAYKNATPEQRALNWFLPLPGFDEPLRVPIPFELGYLFKALPELVYNTAFGDTKAGDAAGTIGRLAWQSVPMGLPQALRPGLEVVTNYSLFTDSPIETARDLGMQAQYRTRDNTSALAAALGTEFLSPVQIDYLIRGYTGGLGAALLGLTNAPVRLLTGQETPELPTKLTSQLPFIGALFQPVDGRAAIDDAYATIQSWQQAHNTMQALIKQGKQAEARRFAQEFGQEVALNATGGAFRQQMGELAQYRRAIVANASLTPEQKREQVDRIRQLEIALARRVRELGDRAS